jgi:hypothetical protein
MESVQVRGRRRKVQGPEVAVDLVNHPPHYTSGRIETLDYIQDQLTLPEFIGYLRGQVLKYGSRLGKKPGSNPVDDAGKMAFYARRLEELLRG